MEEPILFENNKDECTHAHIAELNSHPFRISYDTSQLIKGIAMLMIVFVHCINEYDVYTQPISSYFLIPSFGTMGCSVFFLLSGYGMYHSLSREKKPNCLYLSRRLWKLIKPYLFAFVLSAVCILLFLEIQDVQLKSVFTLSMPDGTDMWFFKTILANYILIFLLFRYFNNDKTRLILLLGIHLSYIIVCFLTKMPGYIYFSNLAFPTGMWLAYCSKGVNYKKRILLISGLVFLTFYIAKTFVRDTTPLEILGNLAFSIFLVMIITNTFKVKIKPLEFIGKHSLLIYLFNVPVMLSIDSSIMSLPSYFILNILLTLFVVYLYLFCLTGNH